MNARIILLTAALCLGACATTPPPAEPVAAVDPDAEAVTADIPEDTDEKALSETTVANVDPDEGDDDVVCRREKRPGTNISRKICRSRAAMEAAADESQRALNQMRAIRSGSQRQTQGGAIGN